MTNNLSIRCEHLSKSYGPIQAIHDVTLILERGQFLALLGPSGCGKTTTLRLLAGFEAPDRGYIWIGEHLVAGPGVFVPPERRRIGMVFQHYALFPHMTVARNVAYGIPRDSDQDQRVQEVLELVGLQGLESRMPHELSGGQQQRVALARALAPRPDVILLDEPFSNLDAGLRVRVRAEVREILAQADATAVFVTHDQEEALSLADQVAVMFQGRVVQCATPEDLYHRPATREVALFVGDACLFPADAIGETAICELGTVALDGYAEGPVEILIRPEALDVTPDLRGRATVIARNFFGHDQLLSVRLSSGTVLQVRLGPDRRIRPGQSVSINVRSPVVAFSTLVAKPSMQIPVHT
jgi:iron(III) transport system ATP-binding protein